MSDDSTNLTTALLKSKLRYIIKAWHPSVLSQWFIKEHVLILFVFMWDSAGRTVRANISWMTRERSLSMKDTRHKYCWIHLCRQSAASLRVHGSHLGAVPLVGVGDWAGVGGWVHPRLPADDHCFGCVHLVLFKVKIEDRELRLVLYFSVTRVIYQWIT